MFLFASTILFICSLFNDAVSKSGHTISKDQMAAIKEMERSWKQAIVVSFKVLSSHLPRRTEQSYKKPHVIPCSRLNATLHLPNTNQKRSPLRQPDNFV
jgi:Mor family transcriptional regulator